MGEAQLCFPSNKRKEKFMNFFYEMNREVKSGHALPVVSIRSIHFLTEKQS